MKMQHAFKAAVAAALLGTASCATANIIQVAATGLPETNYLTAGTYQGSFNLNGAAGLPSNYSINNLSFTFNFLDDSTDPFTTLIGAATGSTTSTTTSTSGSGKNAVTTTTTTTTYLVPVTTTGEQESVKLSFGGMNFFGQTPAVAGGTSAPVTTVNSETSAGIVWAKNNGTLCTTQEVIDHDASCKEMKRVTVEATQATTTTTNYTGSFTLEGSVLAGLLQDKVLNFSFDVFGDLYLTSALLNVDVTPEEEGASNSNEVPEPASLALFGIALAGIAGARRKRGA